MKELETSCKGWARMQAALDNEKKKYQTVHIDLNRSEYQLTDFYKVRNKINFDDKKLEPETVEQIKNFNIESTEGRYNASRILSIYIRQRFEDYPFTGEKCTDAFLMHSASSFEVYLEDQDKYPDFMNYLQSIIDDISKITGIYDIGINDYSVATANVPKTQELSPELQYDIYGNYYEVGDYVARSGFNRTSVFADIIIGRTERSLILLSGGKCHPKNVFVIRKHDGSPVSFSR